MPPKKRATKKKPGLSRGRNAKQTKGDVGDEVAVTTSAASDTDDCVSETQSSPVRNEKNGPSSSGEGAQQMRKDLVDDSKGHGSNGTEEEWKSWEDLPNLVDELKAGGNITYITKTRENRQFELEARKELLQMHFDLDNLKQTMDSSLKVMRNLCPEVVKGKVADAVRTLGGPTTFKDLVVKLMNYPSPPTHNPKITVHDPIFEESETEADDIMGVPFNLGNPQSRQFPSPAKMMKFQTPKQQGPNSIFQFGTAGKGLSTNKAARLPKPGELVYSEQGSPILQRRIPDILPSQTQRVEIVQPDGSKYEVDIVYRGDYNADKLKGFKDFAKDVREIAASRSTSVRQNRVQPPRILTGTRSATKSKMKPEWR